MKKHFNTKKNTHEKSIFHTENVISTKSLQAPNNGINFNIQKKDAPVKNTTGLPNNLKSGIENLSGIDISDVKVHYNSSQPAQLNAHAYAQGNQIHIAPGQQKHLAHEAWHVVQQKQGRVKPTKQLKSSVAINDDKELEKEADLMGAKALQLKDSDNFNKENQSKLSQITLQKKSTVVSNYLPVQRTRLSELEPRLQGADITRFIAYLRGNVAQFREQSKEQVKQVLETDNTDYPELQNWIAGFRAHQQQQGEPVLAGAGAARMGHERPLPQSVSHNGEHVSFQTNVQSGINGLFDIWYYHNLHTLDVDVKFALPQNPTHQIIQTLQAIESFWTAKFHFLNRENNQVVRIDVNVIRTQANPHFTYVSLDGERDANPNVLRANQQFSTRSVEEDDREGRQRSAHHEFGHTLGLGEEYGLNGREESDPRHHLSISPASRGGIRPDERGNVPNSIMGVGHEVQPQHYSAILAEFCRLTGSDIARWQIRPGTGR